MARYLINNQFDQFLKENHINKTTFCKKFDFSIKVLNKILNGQKNVRLLYIYNLAIILKISTDTIYDEID